MQMKYPIYSKSHKNKNKLFMTNEEFLQNENLITFLLETRNKILTFSFTVIVGMFAFSLIKEVDEKYFYIYTIPYFLIVPFAARITYYRLWACYTESYLKIFASNKFIISYPTKYKPPTIERNFLDKFIGFLVNFEMSMLCIVCDIIFYYRCYEAFEYKLITVVIFSIPILSTILVILFCFSALRYEKMDKEYMRKWKKFYNKLKRVN